MSVGAARPRRRADSSRERPADSGRPAGNGSSDVAPVDAVTLRRGLRVLGHGIREQPWMFAIAIAGSALYGAMTVAQAAVLGQVTQRVILPAFEQGRTTTAALVAGASLLFAASAVKAMGVFVRRVAGGSMRYRLEAAYRRRITTSYLRLPLSWHARHPAGRLLSTANSDVEATWFVIAPLPMAVGVLVMLIAAVVAMVLADPVLATVALLVFPAIFALNSIYRRRITPLAAEVQHLRGEVSALAHESFEGAMLVKSLGREAQETERFSQRSEQLRDLQIRVGRIRGLFDPIIDSLPSFGVLVVLLVGAARVRAGSTSAADLVQVAYLFSLLGFPVRAFGWLLAEFPRSVVGWERLRAVLDAPSERRTGDQVLASTGPAAVALTDVTYAYPGNGDTDATGPAVSGVTFDVQPGRTTAIVGPTGSGKSTLASLMLRLFEPTSGAVRIDGIDVTDVRAGSLAESAALVPQTPFLFGDTVRMNVTLGADVDDDEVWDVLRRAHADEFVSRLPEGLDSVVGERGATLSGGQRQRLALARALVRHPRLLVLDDATSAVDTRVEAAILRGLGENNPHPSTLIVVAYRRATIALADEVVYLERGQVLDRGPHEELVVRCAGYRELVTAYDREQDDEADDLDADAPSMTGGAA